MLALSALLEGRDDHRNEARALHLCVASIALALGTVAVVSSYWRSTRKGAIRLPLSSAESPETFSAKHEFTPTEDVEQDADRFYRKERKSDVRLAALALATLIVEVVRCGLGSVTDRNLHWPVWVICAGTVLPWAVVLGLLSCSVAFASQPDRKGHWRRTLTAWAIGALALTAYLVRLIVPRSAGLSLFPGSFASRRHFRIQLATVTLSTALQLAVVALLGATPRHGSLVDPITGKAATAKSSASLFSQLTYAWATPVLVLTYRCEDLAQEELPNLPVQDRADNAWRQIKTSEHLMHSAPRPWNRLVWRLAVVNRALLGKQATLSAVNAVIYYAPAFFLQRLVLALENRPGYDEPENDSVHWAYVYCLGLFLTTAVDALLGGQLWYINDVGLPTALQLQLNALLYSKTLRRKDVSGVASSGGPSNAGDTDEPGAGSDCGDDDDDGDDNESDKSLTFTTKSSVTNLFSIDVERVVEFFTWSGSIYTIPVEIVVGVTFLYSLIGYSAFIGISVAVISIPLNSWTSTAFYSTQERLMKTRDRRISLMTEVLNSMRMIKLYAFERPFEKKILAARAEELAALRRNYFLEVLFQGIWHISPILCVLGSFSAYTSPLLMGRNLTPSTAFAALAVWNELRFAINMLPEVIQSAVQIMVSIRRIEAYLVTAEVPHLPPSSEDDEQYVSSNALLADEPPIRFHHATVTWPSESSEKDEDAETEAEDQEEQSDRGKTFELQDLTIEFPKGEMSLVCGRLGSGKSLLLLSLLGEVDVLEGSVSCPRSSQAAIALASLHEDSYLTDENWVAPSNIAYVPQTAWLQNASIRDNICFGLPFREGRYRNTLAACSLLSDLEILEDGDQTEIGEKGINLSGGQKARVSLARAVYSRASLLLLDDILSAVDAHTAAHIYEQCLKGPLLAGRTVILVSHHVQITAAGAALVVSLSNGRVAFQGTAEDFLESDRYKAVAGGDEDEATSMVSDGKKPPASRKTSSALVPPPASRKSSSATVTSATVAKTKPTPFAQAAAQATAYESPMTNSTDVTSASEGGEDGSDSDPTINGDQPKANGKLLSGPPKPEKKPRKLVEEEGRAVGRVSGAVWKLYLGMMGGVVFWGALAAVFAGSKASEVAETWWLGVWSSDAHGRHTLTYYLTVYAVLSIVAVVVDVIHSVILFSGVLRTSTKLHSRLLHAVLRAPMRWYDSQAIGRILNRFSSDLESVDSSLPDEMSSSLGFLVSVVTTLLVIASSAPLFLVGFAVLCVVYFHQARIFAHAARELRRLESVTESPLFSTYSEAVTGVAVIRAFGDSTRFMSIMLERAAKHISYFWYLQVNTRWLTVRILLLSALIISSTGVVLVAAGDKVSPAKAGFTLTFALEISQNILYLVQHYTSLELSMVGVERIKEYCEIAQEPAEIVEPRPPAYWPQGEIQVRDLRIRYAPDLPDVLQDVSFSIKAGEKVGIVGATGCGKSTLAASFFRFVEAHSGAIIVDGIDISKIGLLDLRSRLTIVPQDPVILSGSLRSTLDMFEQYEDSEILDALRRVHLIRSEDDDNGIASPSQRDENANRSIFRNLDAEVAEGGSNFSTGQRQLLCMARALLRRNKILFLDEATASTDHETDELITETIRNEFSDSTLLVIAHRLRTIIDFDKIMLLDKGRLIEFESPAKLLDDPTSRFYALCRATGRREFALLQKLSRAGTGARRAE